MLHIECLQTEIEAWSAFAQHKQEQFTEKVEVAHGYLQSPPPPVEIRARLAPLLGRDWTGALPATEAPLDASFSAPARPPDDVTLIAVDGSQIFPDRHAAILYYLIQVGAIVFRYNGQTPIPHSRPALYYQDSDLFDAQGYVVSAEKVNLRRLTQEMAYLCELATDERRAAPTTPLFALTDGPLLWAYPERGQDIERAFQAYLEALGALQQTGVIPVGYVDRPGGRAFLELLWALHLAPEELVERIGENPFQQLRDYRLMERRLPPGARTAWFTRPTTINRRHSEAGQEIWFCYLNVGEAGHPVIARVEAPAWAIPNESAMLTLHTALLHQARVLNGYPYVLARAHEEALVTTLDKKALEDVLQRQLMEKGLVPQMSEKARQKAYLGKR
ncbi:MAG TPA: DNA double-strand break repair nuclease NurA [Anaerolineae bacterium]|nr:DNA double-strand break repair nuclease NurA [Anaerolineae bacterium]